MHSRFANLSLEPKGKTFKHYLELPSNVQTEIINCMSADIRCRFSGCSQLTYREVRRSKNYVNEFKFVLDQPDPYVEVRFGTDSDTHVGFRFTYIANCDSKYLKSENLRRRNLKMTPLDRTTNIINYSVEHARGVLQKYQSRIKKLNIAIKDSRVKINRFDFGIENLKNLNELVLHNVHNAQKVFSKTNKNLRIFMAISRMDNEITQDEQIYRVYGELIVPFVPFTPHQLTQLSAQRVSSHIGTLSEVDIFDFIYSWQTGAMNKDFVAFNWVLNSSDFNVSTLFELYGKVYEGNESQKIKITQHKNAENSCVLYVDSAAFPVTYRILMLVNENRYLR